MIYKLQRASVGYMVVYSVILFTLGSVKYPYRSLVVFGIMMVPCIYFADTLAAILTTMIEKTSAVGGNMRLEDLRAVWNEVSYSPFAVLLGEGWGASYQSPAVAGVRVNFTHSLFSSMLLKSGLLGVLLSILYIYGLGKILLEYSMRYPVFILAITGPFLIDVFLYATFKSLDFGLLLLLITAFSFSRQNVASAH
jgi:hypothetical protein